MYYKGKEVIKYPQIRGCIEGMWYPAIAEVKFDGEYNQITYDNGVIKAVNKYGNIKTNINSLNGIASILTKFNVNTVTLLSELYFDSGMNGDVYKLTANKNSDGLNVHVFDITELNGTNIQRLPLSKRTEVMESIGIVKSHFKIVHNKEQVYEYFNTVKSEGYEGIVVKPLSSILILGTCPWVKMKDKDTSNYEVVMVDNHRERIEILVNTPMHEVRVGVKVSNKDKYNINIGDLVAIEHYGILESGSLRNPIFKGKV